MRETAMFPALLMTALLTGPSVHAQDKGAPEAEQVDIDSIKKRYWSQGEDAGVGVVQNRAYSKAGKLQIGTFGGTAMSDPFLNTVTTGLTFGYHFDEYFGLNLLLWKAFANDSSALTEFRNINGGDANTNPTDAYYGVEGTASLLYGKLSLIGKSIIYYDMHIGAGMGLTDTETGRYFTPSIGIGQRFYVTRATSIRLDYRLMYYHERILEKVVPTEKGQIRGTRNNWTNSVTIGVDILWDLF